jgi:DNA-binding NarL/FixJ family response regulator
MRCLIVDDSAAFRDAAASMFERAGVTVVAMASTTSEALNRCRDLRPEVTLVDVDLGDESGFDLAEAFHRADPLVPKVILISTHDEQDLADIIATSPAVGFLPKFALSAEAIRDLLENADRVVEPTVTAPPGT